MLETLRDIAITFQNITLFATSLTLLVTIIIQTIKRKIDLDGEIPKYIAITLGTVLGSYTFLFGSIFPYSTTWYSIILRIALSFVISFLSSEFYELLKYSSKKGTIAGIDQINEEATLSLGNIEEQEG